MGYLDLIRQADRGVPLAAPAPDPKQATPPPIAASAPGRFLRLCRAGVRAAPNTITRPDERNERNEKSPSLPPRQRGTAESQLWRRLLVLARALGGERATEVQATLARLWRGGACLVAMGGALHIVGLTADDPPLAAQHAQVRTLLDALMRDPATPGLLLAGDMPPARAVCRPTTPCWSCKSCRWRQRGDGGWVCGVCHPAKARYGQDA